MEFQLSQASLVSHMITTSVPFHGEILTSQGLLQSQTGSRSEQKFTGHYQYVHSRVIHNPHSIKKFTYKERQKLPYAGFSVFHDEILLLTYRGNILIIIQNTIPFLTLVPIVLEHNENRDSRNTTKSLPENYVNLSMVSKVQAKFPLCLLWTVKMNIKLSEYYTTPFPTPK